MSENKCKDDSCVFGPNSALGKARRKEEVDGLGMMIQTASNLYFKMRNGFYHFWTESATRIMTVIQLIFVPPQWRQWLIIPAKQCFA
ncbi:MAG: hypothetical protein ABIO04_08655, partial [Ferruginibacter sp.]